MALQNLLIDNSCEQLTMVQTIKNCIKESNCEIIRIATGYWDIPGMTLLINELNDFLSSDNKCLQLLIGSDPIVRAYQLHNPISVDAHFPDEYIKRDVASLQVTEQYVETVKLLLQYCKEEEADSRIQIRIYKRDENGDAQMLHAKCYIFLGSNSCGIVGSSNFTQKGLEGNAELNYLESQPAIVCAKPSSYNPNKGHDVWFEERWNQSEPWNRYFLEEVLRTSLIGKEAVKPKPVEIEDTPLTPYELYIKFLQHKYGDLVDRDMQATIESYLPSSYSPLEYQIAAVKQCFSIMKHHGGFMLADVVGLGKTVVGALLIKRFLEYPDEEGRERKVLIITPPAIKSGWENTIKDFDKESESKIGISVDYITTGSIGNLVDEADTEDDYDDNSDSGEFETELKHENYGLIIIDESHKFRNSSTIMYQSLDKLIADIGADTGLYPYIGLLSATPQNNRPDDLKNQIYLFQRNHTSCTLPKIDGGNLESFFSDINTRYRNLITAPANIADSPEFKPMPPEERNKQLIALSAEIRDKVLCDILVRRTRTDVKKYYEDDYNNQNLHFPEISGPHSLKYVMEPKLAELFARTMDLISPDKESFNFDDSSYLCYYRYRAIEFFQSPDNKSKYRGRNMDADRFSHQLAKIMQINLVKRLESSFTAFKASLLNLRKYTENMIEMWENDTIFVCPQIDVNKELNNRKNWKKDHKLLSFDQCAQDIRNKIAKLDREGRNENHRNMEYRKKDFKDDYITLLKMDYELIKDLCDEWSKYSYDPKFEVFKKNLSPVLFDKTRNPSQKLVIFSEAIDTVQALSEETVREGYSTLLITAENRAKMETTIKENFDANYDGEKKDDYRIIITTEVLAEGINLHRANCILNYDTPWNSTRLMQRIGRVNRIGSTADYVYVYNFMPSAQGDNQIRLVQKAHTKLQSFHTLFGEDSKIFTEDEEVTNYALNEVINGEESPYEKYVYELKSFKANNPERYKYLENRNNDLEMSFSKEDGSSFFLVCTPLMPKGLSIKCSPELKSSIISDIDMLEEFSTIAELNSGDLPENYLARKKSALLAFNRHFAKLNINAGKDKQANKAKEIITTLDEKIQLTDKSIQLLDAAKRLVNKGNRDIIKKIISIGEGLDDNLLFTITPQEVETILEEQIEKMVQAVRVKYGDPSIFLGMTK